MTRGNISKRCRCLAHSPPARTFILLIKQPATREILTLRIVLNESRERTHSTGCLLWLLKGFGEERSISSALLRLGTQRALGEAQRHNYIPSLCRRPALASPLLQRPRQRQMREFFQLGRLIRYCQFRAIDHRS